MVWGGYGWSGVSVLLSSLGGDNELVVSSCWDSSSSSSSWRSCMSTWLMSSGWRGWGEPRGGKDVLSVSKYVSLSEEYPSALNSPRYVDILVFSGLMDLQYLAFYLK